MVGREESEEEGRSLDVGWRERREDGEESEEGGVGMEEGKKEEGRSEDRVRLPTRQTSLV